MEKDIRLTAAEQLRKALLLYINTLDKTKALEVPYVYPVWQENWYYNKDEIVSYGNNSVGDPQLYKVISAHMSQADWTPDTASSLFESFGLNDDGLPVWSQPSGAHDAYNTGDIVDYNGTLYKSTIDGNVWSPDAYPTGWEQISKEDIPQEDEYEDFVQPSGAHDAYHTGDIVRYNGQLYISVIDNNIWSPDAYPAGWQVYNKE